MIMIFVVYQKYQDIGSELEKASTVSGLNLQQVASQQSLVGTEITCHTFRHAVKVLQICINV